MSRNYTVRTRILKPLDEVFDAVVSAEKLCRYFSDTSSGDLVAGDRVVWNWADAGDHPVVVAEVVHNQVIRLTLDGQDWHKTTDSHEVAVIIEFAALENGDTLLSISEEGWLTDASGLKASHENCGGWTHMSMCLKAYIEHGIDLR